MNIEQVTAEFVAILKEFQTQLGHDDADTVTPETRPFGRATALRRNSLARNHLRLVFDRSQFRNSLPVRMLRNVVRQPWDSAHGLVSRLRRGVRRSWKS